MQIILILYPINGRSRQNIEFTEKTGFLAKPTFPPQNPAGADISGTPRGVPRKTHEKKVTRSVTARREAHRTK
eukprot:g10683.t1